MYTFLRKNTLIRWDSKLSFPVQQQGARQISFKTNTQTKSLYYIDSSSTIMQWDINSNSAFSLNIKATSIIQATTSGLVYTYEGMVRIMNATGDYTLFNDIIPPSHSFYNASSQTFYLVIGESRVVERAVGGQTRNMLEHDSKINALVVSRNYAYTCFDDGLIYEWSVSEWRQTRVFNATERVRDIAVNEELNVLYIYSIDGMVKEWDLSERNLPVVLFSLGRDNQETHILSYSSNAKVLVIRRDRSAEFWDTVDRRLILELKVSTITEGMLQVV
jgi:WD40 repeat protein